MPLASDLGLKGNEFLGGFANARAGSGALIICPSHSCNLHGIEGCYMPEDAECLQQLTTHRSMSHTQPRQMLCEEYRRIHRPQLYSSEAGMGKPRLEFPLS